MEDLFKSITESFVDLYNNKTGSLPGLKKIKRAIKIAKTEATYKNSEYVNMMYHAIKDLFKLDHYFYYEIVSINERTKEVSAITHKLYVESGIKETDQPNTWSPRFFDELYSGKIPTELNSKVEVIPVSRLEAIYSTKKTLNGEGYINNEYLEDNIDELFSPILDDLISPCSFEEFVYEYKLSIEVKNDLDKAHKLSIGELAYVCYYDRSIYGRSEEQLIQVAVKYGFKSRKLYQETAKLYTAINRYGAEETDKKNSNKLSRIEKILSLLSTTAGREEAQTDIEKLKNSII